MSGFRDRKTARVQTLDPKGPEGRTRDIPVNAFGEELAREDRTLDEPITGRLADLVVPAHLRDNYTLSVLSGPDAGAVFPLTGDEWLLGRGQQATVQLSDTALSRRHARIFRKGETLYLEDNGSTNGTFLQGQRLTAPTPLRDGDRVQLANTVMRFSLLDALEFAAAHQLYESSVRDPLTGVYNRRHLNERVAAEFAYALRHGLPLSVLLIDIDHFKNVNDTYGHQAGDAVLSVLARTLQRVVRAEDVVARYGGEEFVIVLRGEQHPGALLLADRIRQVVERMTVPWADGKIAVTLSIGVATQLPGGRYADAQSFLGAADACLYRGKDEGRNRVVGDQS